VRQIGPHVVMDDAGILDRSRMDERAQPEMACNWPCQEGTHEYSGLALAHGFKAVLHPRRHGEAIEGSG
jgi:hypothetical protein